MKKSKTTSKKQLKKEQKSNTILILTLVILLVIIIVLSLTIGSKKTSNDLPFSSSEFENISTIGIKEYLASLNYDGTSIIFFCSNEKQECFDELEALDKIAKEKELIIEYINVDELVDVEKEEIKTSNNIFDEQYYPVLIVVSNREVLHTSNKYLNKGEIENILKEHKII